LRNQCKKREKRRFLQLLAIVLLSAVEIGCPLPPYATSLDQILDQEQITKQGSYRYRCTTGAHRCASIEYKENTIADLKAADQNPNMYLWLSRIPGPLGRVRTVGSGWKA